MCGIFGYVKSRGRADIVFETMIADAAELMSFRGRDSWGYSAVDVLTDGSHRSVHKELGSVAKSALLPYLGCFDAFVGHTRFATVGAVCEDNSHPFIARELHVVHNGGISNWDDHAKRASKVLGYTPEVDSEILAAYIAAHPGKVSKLQGYGATAWTDNDGRVFVCRMRGGELEAYSVKTKRTTAVVFISSDGKYLHDARMKRFKKIAFESGQVYEVTGRGLVAVGRKLKLAEPRYSRVKSTKACNYSGYSGYNDWEEDEVTLPEKRDDSMQAAPLVTYYWTKGQKFDQNYVLVVDYSGRKIVYEKSPWYAGTGSYTNAYHSFGYDGDLAETATDVDDWLMPSGLYTRKYLMTPSSPQITGYDRLVWAGSGWYWVPVENVSSLSKGDSIVQWEVTEDKMVGTLVQTTS